MHRLVRGSVVVGVLLLGTACDLAASDASQELHDFATTTGPAPDPAYERYLDEARDLRVKALTHEQFLARAAQLCMAGSDQLTDDGATGGAEQPVLDPEDLAVVDAMCKDTIPDGP